MAQKQTKQPPVVLSIAGFDPSSGAGITADVKTIAAHGCYGVTCITALTVQSTRGVKSVEPVEGRVISDTLEHLIEDVNFAAVKIGMLGSGEAARAVAAFLKRHWLKHVVLDPILSSSSGMELISREALQVLKQRLLAQSWVVTPNIDEAAALTSLEVTDLDQMKTAALRLHEMGARNVIVTGGHLDFPCDLALLENGNTVILKGRKITTRSTHGTGCAFSTALACNLALGKSVVDAAKAAKRYVESALRNGLMIGKGIGPVV